MNPFVSRAMAAWPLLFCLLLAACTNPAPASTAPASLDDLASRSLAKIDGDLKVPGLKEPVEVVRDKEGIPHIYAKNDEDLFFAQGYVMAQDRLWQLELWRRWREGRLAEVFGRVVQLSPRRRAAVHGAGQRPQRLHRRQRRPPADRVHAHRHQAGALDRENGGAPLGVAGGG